MEELSIKVKNYKCFGSEEQGFERVLPINIITGRNNSGKSSLLDVIRYAIDPYEEFEKLGHNGVSSPEVFLSHLVDEAELKRTFRADTSGGHLTGWNHWDYGSKLVGSVIRYKLTKGRNREFIGITVPANLPEMPAPYGQNLARNAAHQLSAKIFKRLAAERDIVPEPDTWPLSIGDNGTGITSVITAFFTNSTLPRGLVEKTLLDSLNKIYEPDCSFSRILALRMAAGNAIWQIYLVEKGSQIEIPLSQMGSGFKTILSALTYLHVIPHIEGQNENSYVFAFEELENSLHPAVQRRLMYFIRDFALEHKCHIFVTTHSNVIIDMFSRDDQAQILHAGGVGSTKEVKTVRTYFEHKGICEDLGLRASDLLQTNSVFWVEGPSDHVYLTRWIDIWTDGKLKEGIHYQCVYYGGRLLAHISAANPDEENGGAISMVRINRNALILIDSDKKEQDDAVNSSKKRIVDEVRSMGGVAWVTYGKEIENYIPHEVLCRYYKKDTMARLDRFEDFPHYLESNVGNEAGSQYERGKVTFASGISELLSKDNIKGMYDMKAKLNEICSKIKDWNKV